MTPSALVRLPRSPADRLLTTLWWPAVDAASRVPRPLRVPVFIAAFAANLSMTVASLVAFPLMVVGMHRSLAKAEPAVALVAAARRKNREGDHQAACELVESAFWKCRRAGLELHATEFGSIGWVHWPALYPGALELLTEHQQWQRALAITDELLAAGNPSRRGDCVIVKAICLVGLSRNEEAVRLLSDNRWNPFWRLEIVQLLAELARKT